MQTRQAKLDKCDTIMESVTQAWRRSWSFI